jgi:hypothetical protein
MQLSESQVPIAKEDAHKYVQLQTALTKLEVVGAALSRVPLSRFSFRDNDFGQPTARLGRRATMTLEMNPDSRQVEAGIYTISRQLTARHCYEIAAQRGTVQSLEIYAADSVNMGSTFVSEPIRLLEPERKIELDLFSLSAHLAFNFVINHA